ncbi:hypothetical protein GEMRC1_003398 [Eukaryota sp. GEM-RC1]
MNSISFFVCGITSGLGSSVAHQAALHSFNVFGSSRSAEKVQSTKSDLISDLNISIGDPADPVFWNSDNLSLHQFSQTSSDVHVILISTGFCNYESVFELTPELLQKYMEAHTYPLLNSLKFAKHNLAHQKNVLILSINSSIISDQDFNIDCAGYQISKSALHGLCKSTEADCWNTNISMHSFYPGNYKTNLWPNEYGIPGDAEDPEKFGLEVAQFALKFVKDL